ncbi:MAG: hypothetical protein AcusKO_50320 [Acuticoccus sp.]
MRIHLPPWLWLAALILSLGIHAGVARLFQTGAQVAPPPAATLVPIVVTATTFENVESAATPEAEAVEEDPETAAETPDAAEIPATQAGEAVPPPANSRRGRRGRGGRTLRRPTTRRRSKRPPRRWPTSPMPHPRRPKPWTHRRRRRCPTSRLPRRPTHRRRRRSPRAPDMPPPPQAETVTIPDVAVPAEAVPPETRTTEVAAVEPAETVPEAEAEVEETPEPEPETIETAALDTTEVVAEIAARPSDPSIPYPVNRPPPGARSRPSPPEDLDKLERVPVPPSHPAPAEARAAAYAVWQAAEAERQAAEAQAAAAARQEAEERQASATTQRRPAAGGGSTRAQSARAEAAYARAVRSRIAANFQRGSRSVRGGGTATVTVTIAAPMQWRCAARGSGASLRQPRARPRGARLGAHPLPRLQQRHRTPQSDLQPAADGALTPVPRVSCARAAAAGRAHRSSATASRR